MTIPVGSRVTYDDEDPACPITIGVVTEPTDEELTHVKTYSDPHGPDHGDVLVKWDGHAWDGSWERPEDLQVLS